MTTFVFFIGLFLANLSWFVVFWNNYPYFELIVPKFIANSYDPNPKEELDSILLKSLSKYIDGYLNKDDKFSLFNKTEVLNEEMTNLKVSNSSRFSMFVNNDQMYILQISNEVQSLNKYDSRTGEVSMFYIPLENYRKKETFDHTKSIIRKCWSTKFNGRIIGAVASNDKSNLAIFYRIVEGHNMNYRIRYFHNTSCINHEIGKSDHVINNEYNQYIASEMSETEYYEIKESQENKEMNQKSLNNYFNDLSFDDFAIRGNTPIISMAIKKGVIAYSRNYDYKSFYVLKRYTGEERAWKVSFMGPSIDKKLYPFFHINSLKFINDNKNDYKLFAVSTAMNLTGIYGLLNVVESNHTEYSKGENSTYVISLNFYKVLTERVLGEEIEFNYDRSLKELKRIMSQTVYSQANEDNFLFEFDSGNLYYLSWDEDHSESSAYYINSVKLNEKISKIVSCNNNQVILVKYDNSKDLKYIFRDSNDNKTNFYLYEFTKTISFKSIPKKYREKDGVAYYLENIDDKIILYILNEEGILISLDLSQVIKQGRYWYYLIFADTDLAAWLIIFVNLSALFYINFFRIRNNRLADITQRRTTEINQVIQDIIRLNNIQQVFNNGFNPQRPEGDNSQQEPLIQNEAEINAEQVVQIINEEAQEVVNNPQIEEINIPAEEDNLIQDNRPNEEN